MMINVILTDDQKNASDAFLDFLVGEDTFFTIQGAAGTGKSFLIRHLLETFYSKYSAYCLLLQKDVKHFDIKITATTNKAVNVVEEFLGDIQQKHNNIEVRTIYSLLGLKVTNNYKTGKTELTFNGNKSNYFQEAFGSMIPLVFIDEASFISEELQSIIEGTVPKNSGTKIVYIGDKYQLAPVGQSFSVMDYVKCDNAILSKIVRNSGHILHTGTQFRHTVESGIFKPIAYNQNDVVHMDGPNFKAAVEASFTDRLWNPSKSKVLAWTNVRVQEYNQFIRTTLHKPKLFTEGEVAVTNEFIKGSGSSTWNVDSEVQITKIHNVKTELHGVMGYMVEIDFAYVGFMPENIQDAKAAMKQFAADKDWKKYFEIKEGWLDLRAVYASSIHKAQGSTYETVFLDLSDIGTNWNATDTARLLYVGITRASKQVVCYGYLPDRYTER
jgi:hypothetical protein